MQEKIPFIINPEAGPRENHHGRYKKHLGDQAFEYITSRDEKHLSELVKERSKKSRLICLAGGDSSIDLLAQSLIGQQEKPRICIVPAGTANNFAKSLGIKNSGLACKMLSKYSENPGIAQQVFSTVKADAMQIDYDHDQQLTGMTSFSLGWIAESCRKAESPEKGLAASTAHKLNKKINYFFESLSELGSANPFSIRMDYCAQEEHYSAVFQDLLNLSFVNGPYIGGMKWNKESRIDSGSADALLIHDSGSTAKNFRQLASLYIKNSVKEINWENQAHGKDNNMMAKGPAYLRKGIESAVISMQGSPVEWLELGGKPYKLEHADAPLHLKIIPQALEFLCTEKAYCY